MRAFFSALAFTTCLLTVASVTAGLLVDGERYFIHHFALGLATTLLVCFCHCVVFTYFMATSKMIALAVEDAGLDRAWAGQGLQLKRRAYRALMPAIAAALLTAFSGAWVSIHPSYAAVHLVVAFAFAATHLWALYAEYTVIVENAGLMDRVFARHHEIKGVAQ